MMAALDAGAEDIQPSDEFFEVTCEPSDFVSVKASLEAQGLRIERAEVTQIPNLTVPVDAAGAAKVLRLVDAIDDLDDVQEVFGNFDISDEVMAGLEL